MISSQTLPFQGNLYRIKRTFKEDDRPVLDAWKERLGADIVVKKDNILYFLELIPELEIVEDAPQSVLEPSKIEEHE